MRALSPLSRVKNVGWVQNLPKFHRPFMPASSSALFVEPLALPESVDAVRADIERCQLLGQTFDGYKILVTAYKHNSALMREIGRLRELTFREIGEGTGHCRDIDRFDQSYDHLVLWDEAESAVVGAYRMRCSAGTSWEWPTLYSQTLFKFKPAFQPYLDQGLELGRSFVQPVYQGKRSLDYLWQGIGAYVKLHPNIRYLFGPVSISQSMPAQARQLLIRFFSHWFGCEQSLAKARRPLRGRFIKHRRQKPVTDDYRDALMQLRTDLKACGGYVPPLYKQYTEAFETGGVQFAAFNLDPDFANCVDGFIVADLNYLKAQKRQRYLS